MSGPLSGAWPRPPGAVADFEELCTKCDECIIACPHGSIGTLSDGTPAMDPEAIACHLCADTPCITACLDGALQPILVEDIFFGLARIVEADCFVFRGPECGACAPACPRDALHLELTRPIIDEAQCNGCGLCREACPVHGKAIAIDV